MGITGGSGHSVMDVAIPKLPLCWSGFWSATLNPTNTFLPCRGVGGGQSCGCGRGGAREIPGRDAALAAVATRSVASMPVLCRVLGGTGGHIPHVPGWGMSPFPAFRSQTPALLGRGEIPLWGDHRGPGGRSHAAPRPRQARLDGEPPVWPGRRRFPAPRWPRARLPNETPCTTELPLTPPRYKTPARRSPRTPGTARAAGK